MQQDPNIAPSEKFLNGLPKAHGFQVPDGYFEELPARILFRLKDTKEPELNLPRDSNFQIPQGYFDTLPGRIMTRTQTTFGKRGRIIRIQRWMYAVAAAITIAAVSLLLLYNKPTPATHDVAMEQISDEEIVNYLQNQPVSEDLLADAYSQTQQQHEAKDYTTDTSEQIENYLIETTDEQLIIDEL